MRKLTSFLFISLDGVVESPNKFVGGDRASEDILASIAETIAEQDAVMLGRKTYEEWSGYWPNAKIEPFASFINSRPKYVVSSTMGEAAWSPSNVIRGDLGREIARLKAQEGKTIGVHASVSLVQTLLVAGLLDELRFIQFPVAVGHGRRLLEHGGPLVQLHLESSRRTPKGLQYLVYTPVR